MKHPTRTVGAVVALAALGLGVTSAPAQARPFDQGHEHEVTSSVEEDFCGDLTVRIDDDFAANFLLNAHGDGFAHDHQTIHSVTTFTNLATGKSMTQLGNFVQKDLKITDNGDGTLTILVMSSGSTKVYGPDGKLVYNDPGQTRVEILIDEAGTPDDPFDDEFVDFLGVVKGSTGRNDLQGHAFCDDVHQLTA